MARIPGLIWRPLPESATQPRIRPTQWILHTAVDAPGPTNLGNYFDSPGINLESHTWLSWTKHEQLMDTEVRADANYLANRRPDGTGAISTETEDDGSPVQWPWNDYQIEELIRTGVALHHLHGIPARLCRSPDDPGMGWHAMWGAPSAWTNVRGKTCPGLTRINQFKNIVLPGIQAQLQGAPVATVPQPSWVKNAVDLGIVKAGPGNWNDPPSKAEVAHMLANAVGAILVRLPASSGPGSGATAAQIATEFSKRLAA